MPRKRKMFGSNEPTGSKKPKSIDLIPEDEAIVDAAFNKKFQYKNVHPETKPGGKSFGLEDYLSDNWNPMDRVPEDVELMAEKKRLNALKGELSCQDIETWHRHTTRCNIAAKIIPHVKSLEVELCTQAWLKFSEILASYPVVPEQDFFSVHLCEAPGAFVASLGHYLQQHECGQRWDWRATTLNPYCEGNSLGAMVADDRLIRSTFPRWHMGRDGTGDIMAPGHVTSLLELVRAVEKDDHLPVLLVTADGSRDCQENPAEQESLVSRLHYCEALTSCLLLAMHGNLVIKMFTLFESASVALLYFFNLMFAQVDVTKPVTSKGGNSEVYVVCRDFQKNIEEVTLLKLLEHTLSTGVPSLFAPSGLPASFLKDHKECCHKFAEWQMETIRTNQTLFNSWDKQLSQRISNRQEAVLKRYINLTGVQYSRHFTKVGCYAREPSSFHIIQTSPVAERSPRPGSNGRPHKHLQGTFHLRQSLASMDWGQRIQFLQRRDATPSGIMLKCVLPFGSVGTGPSLQTSENILRILTADCVSLVLNSRLCDASLLDDLNLLNAHSNYKQCRQENIIGHHRQLEKMLSHVLTASMLEPEDDVGNVSKDTSILNSTGLSADLRATGDREDFASQLMSGRPAGLSKFPCCQGPDSVLSSKKQEKESQRPASGRTQCSGFRPSDRGKGLKEFLPSAKDAISVGNCLKSDGDPEQTQEAQKPQVLVWETPCSSLGLTLCRALQHAGTVQVISSTSGFAKDVQVLCCLVPGLAGEGLTEQSGKKMMVESCSQIVRVLPPDSRLILLTSTFLTRFTAGLLYILSRLFRMTWVYSEPNLWLHQFVVLDGFIHTPPEVDHLLKTAVQEMEREDSTKSLLPCVVELVNFQYLLNDRKFVQFVSTHNNCALAGFINLMLDHNKDGEEQGEKGGMESLAENERRN